MEKKEATPNMNKVAAFLLAFLIAIPLAFPAAASAAETAAEGGITVDYGDSAAIRVQLIARYESGADLASGGTEIVAYDAGSRTMFSVNGAEKALDFIDLSSLRSGGEVQNLPLAKRIPLEELHPELTNLGDITSVAKHPHEDYIAVAVVAEPKTDPGYVIFLDTNGRYLHHVQAGPLPDMVTFTPDGTKALAANEGEPNGAVTVNPEGSVTVIDVSSGPASARAEQVGFTGVPVVGDVRKTIPEHTWEQNVEPEYIVVSSDSAKAYVALQENNAIAVLDLAENRFLTVHGLGYKDMSSPDVAMDASDKDGGIDLRRWPVLSAYMPDGMALVDIGGKEYLITPNEGDAADYDGFSEEVRVKDVADDYALDAERFSGYTQEELDALVAGGLFEDDQLGRLKTTTSAPKNADGKYEAVYGLGGRSFSIWDAETLSLVYDSGSEFEAVLARAMPDYFNMDNEENDFDSRSDDKGPEPETAAIGIVGGVPYAFIGLERSSGIMVYDLSDPAKPQFVKYFSSRDLTGDEVGGDVAPEGLTFVPAVDSPTGKALLLAAHEVSGTIAVYEITPAATVIQLVHVNDVHARVFEDANAGMGYAKMAALVDRLRSANPNTLLLDAGDTFHGQTFATLVRGESIVRIMNEMGFDAHTAGNHDFNYGADRLLELAGLAQFPILGANVDRDGADVLPGHAIFEIDGVRIGIFGLATPETAYKTHPNNVKGIVFADPVAEARKQVERLKAQQVDAIVALVHIGMDASSEHTSDQIAAQVDGIDVIVDGHSHQVVSQTINGTLIVQTGEYLKNVGVVTLAFENGRLTGKSSRLISKDEMAEAAPHARIAALIESLSTEQSAVLDTVVGRTDVRLDGERETVRTGESNLGNLIADAMIAATGADAALTNGGGIRASIEAGDITKGDIITVLPFGNYIVTIEATGAEILAALQLGAGDYPEPKGAFPHVAGIRFSIDPAKPKGEKVHSVLIGGEPLILDKTYVLATNDFIAAGGDEYVMFADNPITGHFSSLDEAVIEYLAKGGAAVAVEGRVSVQTAGGAADETAKGTADDRADKEAAGTENGGVTTSPPRDTASPQIVYVVKPGDNLYRIGLAHGVSWQSIAELNRLANPHLIFPGQRLIIPSR